ncbi:hypothetical protein NMG60_11034246 [Bertholletia excelsa]
MATQEFQPLHWRLADPNHKLQSPGPVLILILIFFSILLLLTFFYFYHHFLCHLSTAAATSSSPPSVEGVPPGLDPAAIGSLPTFQHRLPAVEEEEVGAAVKETECSICLGLFEEEEMIKVLPKCNHAYHSECIDRWLSNRSSCPLCRAPLLV